MMALAKLPLRQCPKRLGFEIAARASGIKQGTAAKNRARSYRLA